MRSVLQVERQAKLTRAYGDGTYLLANLAPERAESFKDVLQLCIKRWLLLL